MPPTLFRPAVALLAAALALAACKDPGDALPAGNSAGLPAQPPAAPALDIAGRELRAPGNRLGINLPPVFSWSNTPMYVDLMHQARRFGTPLTPWDEKALLADDGWPVGDFGIFLMSSQKNLSTVGGRYTLRFRGQARVKVVASPATLGTARFDAESNITTIPVDLPDGTDQLAFSFTETRGPVKDLRVIRPGYDAANPPLFTREFLDHIAAFKVVRLMDWLRTNNNPVARWESRATDASVRYASEKGVPWEHAIELARVAGKDLWINIPAQADDDYVRQLATLLRDRLPPDTRLYVEYSNEVWNSMFSQSKENLAAAVRELQSGRDSRLDAGSKGNRDVWKFRRIPQRGMEISDIFRGVFGDDAMMTRVRPVYAIQIVNTYATRLALDYMAATHGAPNRYFFAMAGAPYFNMGEAQHTENLSADQVLAAMSASVDAMPDISRLEENLALAHWYQLPLIAYEGGADSFGPGSLQAKKAAALDPRMEDLCRRHLDAWHAAGGGLFMWFHAGAGKWDTPYGTWELTTDLAIKDTPKIRCMNAVLASPPPAARARNTAPGRFDALAYAGNRMPYSEASRDVLRHARPGRHVDYLVSAASTGRYLLTLRASATAEGNRIDVATAHGSHAGRIELPVTRGNGVVETPPLDIHLRQGLNTLRLTTASVAGGFRIDEILIRGVTSAPR